MRLRQPSSKTTVVLFGDSHAMQWFPALNGLAKEHDWRLVGLTKAACPPELEKEILPYYEQAAEEGLFTQDCGGREAAREDLEFYHTAGQIQDDPATLDVEDFWYLEPLQKAVQNVEGSGS